MAMGYVMRVSRNGQVSIPAEVRSRWQTDEVVVVDLGDHVVMRPRSRGGAAALRGKYRGLLPSVDELRARERAADEERERRRR